MLANKAKTLPNEAKDSRGITLGSVSEDEARLMKLTLMRTVSFTLLPETRSILWSYKIFKG